MCLHFSFNAHVNVKVEKIGRACKECRDRLLPGRAGDVVAAVVRPVVDCDPREFSSAPRAEFCASTAALPRRLVQHQMRQQQQRRQRQSHCSALTSGRDERSDHDVSTTDDHTPPAEPCQPIISKLSLKPTNRKVWPPATGQSQTSSTSIQPVKIAKSCYPADRSQHTSLIGTFTNTAENTIQVKLIQKQKYL